MKFIKFSQIFDFQEKSHEKAGNGLRKGAYPFFTSSPVLSKYINSAQFNYSSLIFGTGGSASVHIHEQPFSVSTDCLVAQLKLNLDKKFEIKFVYYYLSGNISILENGFKGAGLRHISKGYINNIDIPELPIEDQRRIVKILDEANALCKKRKQAIGLLDDYSKSVFLEMFGDVVENSMEWGEKKLKDLCDVGSSKRVFVNELKDSGIPFYRGTEIGKISCGESIKSTLFITDKHYQELKICTGVPLIGDLLMPSICPDGRIWLVDTKEPFYFKDGRVLWIHMREKTVNSIFLKNFLREKFGKDYKSIASGTTFAELKIFALKGLDIILPPINLQNKFASVVEKSELLKQSMIAQSAELETQFQALIQKAFNGKLVTEKVKVENIDWFKLKQFIGVIIRGFGGAANLRGEMVLAKYTYFLQELFDIPMGLQFQKHNFGPYSPSIKKAILGSTFKDKFFKVQGSGEKQVYDLGQNADNLFKYKTVELHKAEMAMNQFTNIIKSLPSQKVELLATVCKVIQDTKTNDLKTIRQEMKDWKTDKREFGNKADIFDEDSTARCLLFVKKQGWDAKLIQK